jgi:hypothetical protein
VLGLSGEECVEESEVEEWITSSSGVLILWMMYFLRNR